jgi:hypothetical protein
MAIVFKERSSPTPRSRFSLDVSEDERSYLLYDDDTNDPTSPTRQDIYDRVDSLLGGCEPEGDGKLARTMPACSTLAPSCFCEDVNVAVASDLETFEALDAENPGLAVPPTFGMHAWKGYQFDVKYRQRPYAVLPDTRITASTYDFYSFTGAAYRLRAFNEWQRFTHYTTVARDTYVQATAGSHMRFRSTINGSVNPPFTGVPEMLMPDSTVTLFWYGVPQSYIDSTSSYLIAYRNTINYGSFMHWEQASLLYLGFSVLKTYTPPQFVANEDETDEVFVGSFNRDRLNDLALTFIHTKRTTQETVAAADRPNSNWLAEGHNLLPHFATRKFYYATHAPNADTDKTKWQPYYLSVPHQVLFQDPDVDGIITAL